MFKVLIVDDSETSLAVLQALCESIGLTCEMARDPDEACALIEANPTRFDIVLLDNYYIPTGPGVDQDTPTISLIEEGLVKIREIFPGFLVGISGDLGTRDGFLIKGVDYFLNKPISADSIERMCDAAREEFAYRRRLAREQSQ